MTVRVLTGDCRSVLQTLPDDSVQCCVTSPPYFGLRDYGVDGQIGLEQTPEDYVAELVAVFREGRRVLRADGTLWLNLGDSYAGSGRGGYPGGKSGLQGSTDGQDQCRIAKGSQKAAGLHERARQAGAVGRAWVPPPHDLKPKDLIGIPWMAAFALRADGWWLRSPIVWAKPNPMPESVTDRPTSSYEMVFLLSKSERYYYDADAIREPASEAMMRQVRDGYDGQDTKDYAAAGAQSASGTKARIIAGARKRLRGVPPYHAQYQSSDQSGLDDVGRGCGSNSRNVWTIATKPFAGAHFATMPPELAERCVLAGSRSGDTILDPFGGAGTTGLVADRLKRDAVLIELNPTYAELARERLRRDCPMFAEVA